MITMYSPIGTEETAMGKGVELMEWQTYQKSTTKQKYEKYIGKPFLVVHPNGTVYMPPKMADRLGEYYVMLLNKNFAGFRKTERLDPNAYHITGKGGNMRQLGTKDFLIKSRLLVPDKIAVWLVEEVGDVVMVNVTLGPAELLEYTRKTIAPHSRKSKKDIPLTPPDNITSVEIISDEARKLEEEHQKEIAERQRTLDEERKKLMTEFTNSF